MPRQSDLVVDSKLDAEIRGSITIHSFQDIDDSGRRSFQEEYWQSVKPLGQGGCGQVRQEKCIAGTKLGALRAVKIINTQTKLNQSLDFNRELEAVAKFSHNRVSQIRGADKKMSNKYTKYKRWFVRSYGWYEDQNSIFIAMEYCRHGDLDHYLRDQGSLAPTEVQYLTHQILEGLDHMHRNDFAHRDLKPGVRLI
jgi:serine/threonine protein kinase